MSKHAVHGPSSLDSLSKCIRFKYSDSDNDAASEGTELHEAAERESTQGLTESQARDVQTCIDYVSSIRATDGGPAMWADLKESQVELKGLTHGTCDRLLVHQTLKTIHVVDHKFTRVESDHEFQIETYGAAAYEMYYNGVEDVQIHLHVIEPRINDIKHYVHDGASLHKTVVERISELYQRIDDPWNPETPDEYTCAKCARAFRCPSLRNVALQVTERIGLPVPMDFAACGIATDRDCAIAMALVGPLKNWAEETKKALTQRALETGRVPANAKLVTRSSGLRVAKEMTPMAIEQLLAAGFNNATIMECCSLTLSELAEKHSEHSGMSKADAKELMREALGDLAKEGSSTFLQMARRRSDEVELLEAAL